MTIRLYLLRHAEAEPALGRPDLERELTAEGAAAARRAALTLARLGLRFDRGLTSPAVRAVRTAEVFWQAAGAGELTHESVLAPGADPEEVVALLKALPGNPMRVLTVGHMPDLGQLVHHLVCGRVSAATSFGPGKMVRIDFAAEIAPASGMLVWGFKPAELAALTEPDSV